MITESDTTSVFAIFEKAEQLEGTSWISYADPDLAIRDLEEIRSRKQQSRMTLPDRIRLDQWAHFEKAKHLRETVTLLGIYFRDDGTCVVEILAQVMGDPPPPSRFDELLLDHVSGLIIRVGNVIYDLEGRLEQLG